VGDFKPGDVANMGLVDAGIERMHRALRRAGYIQSKVLLTRHIDEGHKAVDVAVHVDAGPQYSMGKLALVGLDLEGEAEIKRMWGMKEGKPFDPEYPDKFLERVRSEGVFDHLGKTSSSVKQDDKDRLIDVTLNFGADATQARPGRRGGRGGRGYLASTK